MMRSLFLLASGLLVLTNAGILLSREVSKTYLGMCVDTDITLTPGSLFEIKSPNYDWGNYADNTRCFLSLRSGADPLLLEFKIESIDLEMASRCVYDYLCINGARFCGNRYVGQDFMFAVPANSSFTLGFIADSSGKGHGFYLTGRASVYNNAIINVADGGSSSESFYFSTYSPDNYTDRCGREATYYSSIIPPSSSYSRTTLAYSPTHEYTSYYPYSTDNPWYYSTTYNSYNTDYYYSTTYNTWYHPTTNYYQYTSDYYHSTTYNIYSTWYYDTTTYNTGYYPTTSYYQYSSGYYYATTYNPYSTWYYDSTTYNPCQNGYYYTTGYCQYYTSSPSYNSNDYIANELRSAMQEISSEQASQAQLYNRLANLLAYLANNGK